MKICFFIIKFVREVSEISYVYKYKRLYEFFRECEIIYLKRFIGRLYGVGRFWKM